MSAAGATRVRRRDVLRALGWSATGITALIAFPGCSRLLPPLPTSGAPDAGAGHAWLQLDAQGHFRLVSPRQEIGQGISASLRAIVAEEIGIAPERVLLSLLRTDRIEPVGSTVGSQSILDYARPLAIAAANLREALVDRAATQLDVSAADVTHSDDGMAAGGKRLDWATLAAGEPILLEGIESKGLSLRSFAPEGRRHVGQPHATDRIREIVTGGALFAGDVRRKGMLYGRFAQPAKLGARLSGFEARAAEGESGVVSVVEFLGSVGVVAETPMALERGLVSLACRWEVDGEVDQGAIDAAMDIDANEHALEHEIRGDRVETDRGWSVDLRVDVPMAAHLCMEPKCAVAEVQDDRAEIWTGTQDAFFVRDAVRKHLGLPTENVVVHSQRLGGGFGSGSLYWPAVEAALLSRAVGRPVNVTWTRSDCFQRGYHRPPSTHRLRVRVGDDGRITDWHHRFKSGHVIFTSAAMPAWLQKATSLIGDFGVARGADPPYAANRTRVEFSDVRIPVDTGPWRGLGAAPNHFAVESAVDETARATGQDPLAFRLAHIDDERLRRVLSRAAELAGWTEGDERRGRGLACGIYKEMSYAAVVADVELGETTGTPRVRRLVCAHDCGLVVNPDQVRAQIEGNLIWGLGMVLSERLGVAGGRIDADAPGPYRVPTVGDVPEIEIELVSADATIPTGAGETAIVGAAAISNALAGLVGQPATRLPVRPEALLARFR
ncbi:MAG: molybdopterin-dependent oxidoreductase [bacterium]|nr:molybdopterin-dependent oxidoreductase [bacterium]